MFPRNHSPAKSQALRIYEVTFLNGGLRQIYGHYVERIDVDDALLIWRGAPGEVPALVASFRLSAIAAIILIA